MRLYVGLFILTQILVAIGRKRHFLPEEVLDLNPKYALDIILV